MFVGNLDTEVDEKLLYDTFSAFGVILQPPKIMRDLETGNSKVSEDNIYMATAHMLHLAGFCIYQLREF